MPDKAKVKLVLRKHFADAIEQVIVGEEADDDDAECLHVMYFEHEKAIHLSSDEYVNGRCEDQTYVTQARAALDSGSDVVSVGALRQPRAVVERYVALAPQRYRPASAMTKRRRFITYLQRAIDANADDDEMCVRIYNNGVASWLSAKRARELLDASSPPPRRAHSRAASVRYVFEDGAIRFSAISATYMTGASVCRSFARALLGYFTMYPNAHTAILCFDDKRHVHTRKSATQTARRDAMARAPAASQWRWDGETPIINPLDDESSLPVWTDVRRHADSYRRALEDIVRALLTHFRPPPSRRVLLDSHLGVYDIRASGYTLCDASAKPDIGEADIAMQYYAELATRGDDEWPAGVFVAVTTDTDFLPLALVAGDADVLVDVGLVRRSLLSDAVCTRTSGEAIEYREIFDIARLRDDIGRWSAPLPRRESLWSFVAFIALCGNDYVERFKYFSHERYFATYRRLIADDRRLLVSAFGDGDVPIMRPRDYMRFIASLYYYERLSPATRPQSWSVDDALPSYAEIASHVRAKNRLADRWAPSGDALSANYEAVLWSLFYAATARRGKNHIVA